MPDDRSRRSPSSGSSKGRSSKSSSKPRSSGSQSGSGRSGSSKSGKPRSGPSKSGKPRSGSTGSGKPRSGSGASKSGKPRSGSSRSGSSSDRRGETRSTSRGGGDRPPTGRARQWGSLARRGAQRASEPEERHERSPSTPATPEDEARRAERARRRAVREADQERLRSEARHAVDRAESRRRPSSGTKKSTARAALPKVPLALDEPEVAIARLVGKDRAPEHVRSLGQASQSFARERYHEARRQLAPVLRAVPDVPEVAELQGLIQYRLGNWKAATDQLEHFRTLTGTTEQHPVLADCYRALGRYGDVDELWDELRAASPSAELVTEGRIVAAGARADQADLTGAIAVLEKGWNRPKRPRIHHLRRAYALADLYERNGRAPRARELFRWIQANDASFADVGRRVQAL